MSELTFKSHVFNPLDSTAELERHEAMLELEQLKRRVAELEEKLRGKKKGGLKFMVPVLLCTRLHEYSFFLPPPPPFSLSLS